MQEVNQVYSVVLMMAMTTGGDAANLGHRGGCCGETAHCGSRHHGGGCGQSSGCGTCGQAGGCSSCGASYGGCATCGYAAGCSTCASGACPVVVASTDPTAAVIVVSLPADAILTIDDQPTTSTSDHRVFVSPSLSTGKEYTYTLKAAIPVNGKPMLVSQVVTVRAGEESQVTLAAPTGVAAR